MFNIAGEILVSEWFFSVFVVYATIETLQNAIFISSLHLSLMLKADLFVKLQ